MLQGVPDQFANGPVDDQLGSRCQSFLSQVRPKINSDPPGKVNLVDEGAEGSLQSEIFQYMGTDVLGDLLEAVQGLFDKLGGIGKLMDKELKVTTDAQRVRPAGSEGCLFLECVSLLPSARLPDG